MIASDGLREIGRRNFAEDESFFVAGNEAYGIERDILIFHIGHLEVNGIIIALLSGHLIEAVVDDVEIGRIRGVIAEEILGLFSLHSFEEFSAAFLRREEFFDVDIDGAGLSFCVRSFDESDFADSVINVA